ncbi:MAG TPA: hypothetical protein DDW42_03970 [Desulfobacteraceae bacterium]|nr:hypothetical protein [Desulfobacteraceae bacterium]
MVNKLLLLGIFFFFQSTFPGMSQANLVPSSLLKWSDKGADYAILVDKSAQKVYLYQRDDPGEPLNIYRCSTGENSGPKSKKNDRKTPEGIYFFTNTYVKRQLSAEYGVRAFPIDYPNPIDRMAGRGGYGIWLHGKNEPLKPRDTKGCIVLENRSINDLAPYIELNRTPLIVVPKVKFVSPEKLEQETAKLESILDHWRQAWQRKDLASYMDFYDKNFVARGMGWHRWKAYKRRLAKKYRKIYIKINNLQIFRAKDVVLAKFNQSFHTVGFDSNGEKRLYLAKKSNQWKIFGEYFRPYKFSRKASFQRPEANSQQIKQFISMWKMAWERRDFRTYIGLYDRRFQSNGMDLRAWKRYKARLNKKHHSVQIGISDVKIIKQSKNSAYIRFKQNFQAGSYHDLGLKDLFIIRHGRQWKIKKETWCPINTRSLL